MKVAMWAWVVTALFMAGAILVAVFLGYRSGVTFAPKDGISAFALFYIAAAGVERILEPFSGFLVRGNSASGGAPGQPKASLAAADKPEAETNGTLVMWGASTLLAAVACWYFGLSLFAAVGVTGGIDSAVALFVTAILIGSGTKPLHDFISTLEKAKAS